jgi:hypothetical protein
MYRFYDEPQSENAIGLFNYLKELSKEHPERLRIFIKGVEWKGG